MSLRLIIERLRKHTGMYVPSEEYLLVCTFLEGYDFALERIPLCGFRQWLAVREGKGGNLGWPDLARDAALKGRVDSGRAQDERILIDTMFDLLSEFLDEVDERGVDPILARYEARVRPNRG